MYTVSLSICITFPLALQKSKRICRIPLKVFTFFAFLPQSGSANNRTRTSKLATHLLQRKEIFSFPQSFTEKGNYFNDKAIIPAIDLYPSKKLKDIK